MSWKRYVGTMATVILFGVACGDDDGPGQNSAVATLAQELTNAIETEILQDETQSSVKNLALSLVQSLTDAGTPAPSAREASAFALVRAVANGGESEWIRKRSSQVLAQQAQQPPRVPLSGITCVWSVDADFWIRDAADPFGTVPEGSVRFALYDALGGSPVVPLSPIPGAFTDIAPISQAPQNNGILEVAINAFDGTENRFDGVVSGTFNGLVNAALAGVVGGESTGFDASAGLFETESSQTLATAAITAPGDAGIFTNLTLNLDGSGTASVLVVEDPEGMQGTGAFVVQFIIDFDANLGVSSGSIIVLDQLTGVQVAGLIDGGTLVQPQFSIDSAGPLSSSDGDALEGVYDSAWVLNVHLAELLNIGLCVGTESPRICSDIPGL